MHKVKNRKLGDIFFRGHVYAQNIRQLCVQQQL